MKTVFLLLTALVTTAGFNILKDAVVVINEGEPLFGQETIQSKNGILVTSPTSGKLFRCELNGNCTVVTEDTAKGLRPIQSASSMLTGQTEEEQHLVCQQIKTKVRVKEELNGRCLYQVSSSQKEIIDPAEEANNIAIANNTNQQQQQQQQQQ
ncbi:hypothetical protein AALO_G00198610 [Alosa alosa]|uniref:Uncharacterized protein n=1 Tax=Alosa alosa TaxID=278164 RepID=A0AAV6G5H3_9TELE|nr:hypothetical protein AALO_G00198610 [Alosa alosa]